MDTKEWKENIDVRHILLALYAEFAAAKSSSRSSSDSPEIWKME